MMFCAKYLILNHLYAIIVNVFLLNVEDSHCFVKFKVLQWLPIVRTIRYVMFFETIKEGWLFFSIEYRLVKLIADVPLTFFR